MKAENDPRPDLFRRSLSASKTFTRQYRLLSILGAGATGVVFLAEQKELNRKVAMKVVDTSIFGSELDRKRFRREARLLAELAHPCLVKLYTVGDCGSLVYLASEFINGRSLQARLRYDPPAIRQSCGIIIKLAGVLQYLHNNRIVHRDVKPENVILHKNDDIKLIDFGLARPYGDSRKSLAFTRQGKAVGTPYYMSPEAIRGKDINPKSDIYSLSAVLFECLTGSPPYTGSTISILRAHIDAAIPRPSLFTPGLPGGFDRFIRRGLAKNPRERPDAGDFAKELSSLSDALSQSMAYKQAKHGATRQTRGAPPPKQQGGRRMAAAVICLLSVLSLIYLNITARPAGTVNLPPGLNIAGRRGHVYISWSGSGDIERLAVRRLRESSARTFVGVSQNRAELDRLIPLEHYRLEFLYPDQRRTRSFNLAGPMSCLTVEKIQPPAAAGLKACARFSSSFPLRIVEGKAGRSAIFSSDSNGLKHNLYFSIFDAGLARFSFRAVSDTVGAGEFIVHPPSVQLEELIKDSADSIEITKIVSILDRTAHHDFDRSDTHENRRDILRRALVKDPDFLGFLCAAPFIPTVFTDPAIEAKRKRRLFNEVSKFVVIDTFSEFYSAFGLMNFEELLGPYSELLQKPGKDCSYKIVLKEYPETGNSFAPLNAPAGIIAETFQRIITDSAMNKAAPMQSDSISFVLPDNVMDKARVAWLEIEGHIFSPCYILWVDVNDRIRLPFHHKLGKIDFGRIDGPSNRILQLLPLRRSFPPDALKKGKNSLRIRIRAPLHDFDPHIPVLKSISLMLDY